MAPWIGCFVSGVLLAAAFPPLEWNYLAWIGLVPMIIGVRFLTPGKAFFTGLLGGTVFWSCSLFWLTHVTIGGWLVMAFYCALYMAPFAMMVSWWLSRYSAGRMIPNMMLMLLCVIVWCGFEFMRSIFITGFAWNTLGTCLYSNLPVIQIARWGGVYAVSALIVWVNAGVALTILRYLDTSTKRVAARWHPEFVLSMLAWALSFAVGARILMNENAGDRTLKVALVQPNIAQEDKWLTGEYTLDDFDRFCQKIYKRLRTLTAPIMQQKEVDLVVWPETALPDDVLSSVGSYNLVFSLTNKGVPLLLGSMDTEWLDDNRRRYYNSSFLFGTNGTVIQEYDKQHLVMFGEYIPLHETFPFIAGLTPIQESFSEGTNSTLFQVPTSDVKFSALICFEDTLAYLARKAVRKGARLLVNQTNDAWFDPSSGSKQHMMHGVFRSIENAVPTIRSANTGISCVIDRFGRVVDAVSANGQVTMMAGTLIADVAIPPAAMPLTFYCIQGDTMWSVMAILAGGIVLFIVWEMRRRHRFESAHLD